jgi:transposase
MKRWLRRGRARARISTAASATCCIGSRGKETLAELVGEAFLGWLVTDGYVTYRDRQRRQHCLAHLIRKAIALAQSHDCDGSGFGRDLLRDLRNLIEKVAGETLAGRDSTAERAIKRLLSRIKWNCQGHQYECEAKVRALVREILNDWDAVIAFVTNPLLPATNNDAGRALRHVVLARRIGFGTRTDKGGRFYATAPSPSWKPAASGKPILGPTRATSSRQPGPAPSIPSYLPWPLLTPGCDRLPCDNR